MVLDCVVRATGKKLRDLGPLVFPLFVSLVDDVVLFFCPRRLFDRRIQMVVPTFTALLSDTALQVTSNECPLLWPITLDKFNNLVVFLFYELNFASVS